MPTRLALHFIFAIVLIAYALWFYLILTVPAQERVVSEPVNRITGWSLVLLTIQLIFGALMAGHKAATAAPTWPDINGSYLPASIFVDQPFLLNFIENKITIHFVHRNLAYIAVLLISFLTWKMFRMRTHSATFNNLKIAPLTLVVVQLILGILSLKASRQIVPNRWGAFEWLAQAHQLTGILMALSLVALLYVVRRR
jgi:cytochrome c oxidase assembly protein subunit 15